jgi:xylose isomerase
METAFKNIPAIKYEGPKSKKPLAFKHYNLAEIVEGKTLRDHLRFSVVYWHTFRGVGSDPSASAPPSVRGTTAKR